MEVPPVSLSPWNPQAISISLENKPVNLTIFPPYYAKMGRPLELTSQQEARLQFCHQLVEITKEMNHEEISSFINRVMTSSPLNPEEKEAIQHHFKMIKQLQTESYLPEDIEHYLQWSLRLTMLQLKGFSHELEQKISTLCLQVLDSDNYEMIKRGESDDISNNPSYFLRGRKDQKSFAILKLPTSEYFSSFSIEIPTIKPLLAPVWQHEIMSCEQDWLFGFEAIPPTVAVELDDGEVKRRGVIQHLLSHVVDANALPYEKGGALLLKSLSVATVHRLVLESLFLGFAAGHGANYVMERDEQGLALKNCYIIDAKETFIPVNRPSSAVEVKEVKELEKAIEQCQQELEGIPIEDLVRHQAKQEEILKLKNQTETVYQSLVVMRIWIMGLPQAKKAFDRATLLAFTHPALLPQLKSYHKRIQSYYQISQAAQEAQIERVEAMQVRCLEALEQEPITLTPRELFFDLFGGREIFEEAKRKGYPDTTAFIRAVSHPYHSAVYRFGDPSTLPPSPLQGLNAEEEKYRILFENIKILEET